MRFRKTVMLMVIYLLGQQVAAAAIGLASVFPVKNESGVEMNPHTTCHEMSKPVVGKATKTASHQHSKSNDSMGDKNCCDVDCRCCIGGCSSALNSQKSNISVVFTDQFTLFYMFAIQQTLSYSLFRPPIST